MRPIRLDIAGLNSFRQKRTIDFEPLLQDNLFGIFGPTGSGKSTILDAMTLALFGEVKRADRKTSGIVNARMEECSVSFTFELQRDGNRTRYRAERMLKKSDTGGAVTKRARLIEMGDDEVPLADKEREMTEQVESLLGVRAEDFRLSVVLPQGAFADFLHLKKAQQGEMLQRIFGLEEMGKRIAARLSDLSRDLKAARGKLDERLAHLKQFDDEALEECRAAVQATSATLAEAAGLRNAVETELRRAEELAELLSERTVLLENESQRAEERRELQRLETAIELAERCRNLEAVMRRAEETARRYREAHAQYEKTLEAKNAVRKEMDPLRKRREWADEQRDSDKGRLPALKREIDELKTAADLEGRVTRLGREVAERTERNRRNGERLEQLRASGKEAAATQTEAEAELERRKKHLDGLAKKREELLGRKGGIDRLEHLAAGREEKLKSATGWRAELETLRKSLDATGKEKSEAVARRESAEQRVASLRDDLERARIDGALAEAGSALRPGEPCPLCGALDHPHPHEPAPDKTKEIRAAIVSAEADVKSAGEHILGIEKRAAEAEATARSLRSRIEEAHKEIAGLEEAIAATVAEIDYKGETDVESLRGWKMKFAELETTSAADLDAARKAVADGDSALKRTGENLRKAREEYAGLDREIKSGTKELAKEEKELEEETGKYDAIFAKLGLDPETFRGRTAARRDELIEEHNRLEGEIKRIDEEYDRVKDRLTQVTAQLESNFNASKREESERDEALRERDARLRDEGFESVEQWNDGFMNQAELTAARTEADRLEKKLRQAESRLEELDKRIDGREISDKELGDLRDRTEGIRKEHEEAISRAGVAESALKQCERGNSDWKAAVEESERTSREFAAAETLQGFLRGNAFISFLADERLQHICRTASHQLLELTGGRLEIGTTSEEGFYIRDNGNGSVTRPPSTLSGGETFLVSLSLALALSDSLRVGRAPLEFFFLDEGFGTLDNELLDIVMDSLERLRAGSARAIGVISHVRELRERLPRRLIVTPADESEGSDIQFELS